MSLSRCPFSSRRLAGAYCVCYLRQSRYLPRHAPLTDIVCSRFRRQLALDALLRGDVRPLAAASSASEDDTGEPTSAGRPVNPKEDPSNVEGLRSLWVGNIMQTVSERELRDLFAR